MRPQNDPAPDKVIMTHDEAMRTQAAERYVLGELAPELRDAYEEHFFDCTSCADEVLLAARVAEGVGLQPRVAVPVRAERRWWSWGWLRSPVPGYAMAVSLAGVLAFQSLVTIPRLSQQTASLVQPLALASFNLTTLDSRALIGTVIDPPAGVPYSLLVSIPPDPPARSYEIVIVGPANNERLRVAVSAEAARDTIQLLIPPGRLAPGSHRLRIDGVAEAGPRFEVSGNDFTVQ